MQMKKSDLKKLVRESVKEVLNEYKTYVIKDFNDLIDGLKEIGAPIKFNVTKSGKTIKVDNQSFQIPVGDDSSKHIKFDDKIVAALRKNKELMKMWKETHTRWTNIVKNLKSLNSSFPTSFANMIDWGPTSPDKLNKLYSNLEKMIIQLKPLVATAEAQKQLRVYEVLRHLFDRGYSHLAK